MLKNKLKYLIYLAPILVVLSLAFLLLSRQVRILPLGLPVNSQAVTALEFSYIPVTPQLADYYKPGTESGALVTDVLNGSPADKAGLKIRHIILSFNGPSLTKETSLFGLLRGCPPGVPITLEVRTGGVNRKMEINLAGK